VRQYVTRRQTANAGRITQGSPIAIARTGKVSRTMVRMNDFHIALLWLRSLELLIGHSPVLVLSELDMSDLFMRYRSPYKA
jgi:hypothetical protein